MLAAEHHAADVDRHHMVPVGELHLLDQGRGAEDPGIVEEDVEAARFLSDPRHRGEPVRLARDVERQEDRAGLLRDETAAPR